MLSGFFLLFLAQSETDMQGLQSFRVTSGFFCELLDESYKW